MYLFLANQKRFDFVHECVIVRFNSTSEALDKVSLFINEELFEIPVHTTHVLRITLTREVLKQWVLIISLHGHFGEHREFDTELGFTKFQDLLIRTRLLVSKVVCRETEYDETLVGVGLE